MTLWGSASFSCLCHSVWHLLARAVLALKYHLRPVSFMGEIIIIAVLFVWVMAENWVFFLFIIEFCDQFGMWASLFVYCSHQIVKFYRFFILYVWNGPNAVILRTRNAVVYFCTNNEVSWNCNYNFCFQISAMMNSLKIHVLIITASALLLGDTVAAVSDAWVLLSSPCILNEG